MKRMVICLALLGLTAWSSIGIGSQLSGSDAGWFARLENRAIDNWIAWTGIEASDVVSIQRVAWIPTDILVPVPCGANGEAESETVQLPESMQVAEADAWLTAYTTAR
jgi:hypothetical protein